MRRPYSAVIDDRYHHPSPPAALDAAIQAVERSLRPNGPDAAGLAEGERAGVEWRALRQWCSANCGIVAPEVTPERSGGREHEVRFVEADRCWLKFTKWNCAGYTVDFEVGEPLFLPASPLAYLHRLRLHNTVFGDELRLLGIQSHKTDLRMVSAQPDIVGEAPSPEELDRQLREAHGFRPLAIPPMGYHKSHSYLRDAIGLFDVHPANAVVSSGGMLVPIDFILVQLDPLARTLLEQRIKA